MPPCLAGIAPVAKAVTLPSQSLDAVYFDTPSHDLAAKRITLRRRTGGADAGWQLKLPAGDLRTEVRAPLGKVDNVPTELLDVVLAVVRDRPLSPVARIATTRVIQLLYGDDDAVLAEFCDDRVTARTAGGGRQPAEQHWREWELELVNADELGLLDRLGNRLLDTGARPAGYGSKLARALHTAPQAARPVDPVHRTVAEQVDELLVWDRAVRADADDAVHQMRVTTRKIRSLLEVFAFCQSDDAWVLDELRELAGLLGAARDAEVLGQRYRHALDRLPTQLVRGRVTERLVDGAARRYQTGRRRSLTLMRSPRYFRLLDGLDALVAESPNQATASSATIDTAYQRVCRAAEAAADTASDEALHRIRKGAKRLRYVAAAMDAPQVATRAKAVQTLLGDHQDSVVSRRHLIQQADAAHTAGEDIFTYGLLYHQEEDLADSCRAQLNRALSELAEAMGGRVDL